MSETKRKREVDGEDIARILTSTAFATQHLHKELGPEWTAVLLEACCVRAKEQRTLLPAGKSLELSFREIWSVRERGYAGAAAYRCSSGSGSAGARGMGPRGCALPQPVEATWACSSTRMRMGVHGIRERALRQP